MKSVIVGTAGHIDHGKTALVKALTGIDADRLAEEKRRGITIDLGFAHLELEVPSTEYRVASAEAVPSSEYRVASKTGASPEAQAPSGKLRIGFVDVPGHERFVRNMLAGVGGIDLVLLVVAADEGIKPQTREHFEICRLLNIPRGLAVLTKSDLVDKETLDVVRLELEDYLRGSFLEGAPIVAVSSKTGAGIEELKRELAGMAAEVRARDAGALFRLPIDRVFSMKGFGTVVTGTLISGSIRKEDEVEVFPARRRVRIRGVEVHGAAAEQVVAGQRTALNLAGIEKDDLARGMTLAPPGMFRPTQRLDVSLTLLKSARALKDRSRVHFHAYTAETVAEVVLLDGAQHPHPGVPEPGTTRVGHPQVAPGATAFAQLRLQDPVLLLPGDRFILRQFSPVVTIGGGVALDAAPLKKQEKRAEFLATLAAGEAEEIAVARLARRSLQGLSMQELAAETGWTPERVAEVVAALNAVHRIVKHGDHLTDTPAYAAARKMVQVAIDDFHARNPLVAGMNKEDLRSRLELPAEVFEGVLRALVKQQAIEIPGEQVRAAGRAIVMKDDEAESKQTIEQAFASAGLKVPALKEVLAGLKLDRARAQKIVTLLLREKILVKLSDDLVFHREALAELRRRVGEHKKKSAKMDVATFKELSGVSRKYAIPLLEWLDRERVTRRVGDAREIL